MEVVLLLLGVMWDQDMQGKVHCPVIIMVAGYLITIALEELLY